MYAVIKHIEIKRQVYFHNQQLDNCKKILAGRICWHCISIYTYIYIEKNLKTNYNEINAQLKVIVRFILNTNRYVFQK